jgi:hypothetical protein
MSNEKEAHTAIDAVNGFNLGGRRLNVEESISEVRQKPGMGGSDKCFFCGDGGHWSRDCPKLVFTFSKFEKEFNPNAFFILQQARFGGSQPGRTLD